MFQNWKQKELPHKVEFKFFKSRMFFTTELLLVAVTCVCLNVADSTITLSSTAIPMYMWPMNGKYEGREVKQSAVSLNTANFKHINVVNSTTSPLRDKTALYFNKSAYLDFSLTNTIQFQSIAITLFIRPEENSLDCTFLHYKAHDVSFSKNEIVEIRGHGDDNHIKFEAAFGNHQTKKINLEFSEAYKLANLVTFVYSSLKNSELHLFIGKEHKGAETEYASLKLPGTLRFGGHLSRNECGFHGEMFCAALFNLSTGVEKEHYKDSCNNIELPEPVLLWPLNEECKGYEVRTNQSPTYFSVDAPRYQYTHTALMNSSVRFDGSFMSSIASTISSDLLHQHFTLVMYIFLNEFSDGTVLYISGTNSLILTVINSRIALSLHNNKERQPSLEILSSNTLTKNEWHLVSVARAHDMVHLTVDGNVDSTHLNNCWTSGQSIPESQQIIFGAKSESDEGFKGAMICVAAFNYSSNIEAMIERLNESCSLSSNMCSITKDELAIKRVLHRTSNQELVSLTHKPPDTINQIHSVNSKSLTNCGKKCLETAYCRSYTYTKQTLTCHLYDIFIKRQLLTDEGVKYYLVKSYH